MIDPVAGTAIAAMSATLGVGLALAAVEGQERKAWRERCNHQWGPVTGVNHSLAGNPTAWKQWCRACSHQVDVNEDGSPYVPGQDTREPPPGA